MVKEKQQVVSDTIGGRDLGAGDLEIWTAICNGCAPVVITDGAGKASSRMTDRGAESEQGLGLEDYRTGLGFTFSFIRMSLQ